MGSWAVISIRTCAKYPQHHSTNVCTHVNSLRITWVEQLKNTAPYRTLGCMTSLYDIVVCYLCSLIWPMSMKALAKKQRRHDNLHREMDSHVTTSKFQTVFRLFGWSLWQHHPSKSERPGMERHSLSWDPCYRWRIPMSEEWGNPQVLSKEQCPETPSQLLPFIALPPNGGESCNAKD